MSFVRGIPEARWIPSRYNFALFRLAAFCRLALRRQRGFAVQRRDVVFFVDRHQSSFEHGSIALWITATAALFVAASIATRIPLSLALVISIPLGAVAVQLPMFLVGGVVRPLWNLMTGLHGENNIRMNSVVLMVLLIGWSIYFARSESWIRFAGLQFLVLVGINGVCAVILMGLRGPVSRLERLAGGSPSEP